MKKFLIAKIMCVGIASALIISGCTQMPTEKQSISDLRPQVSFQTADDRLHNARIVLDGLQMGTLGNYLKGVASLRILPGTHVIQVISGDKIVTSEKFYIGDGVNRTFIVN